MGTGSKVPLSFEANLPLLAAAWARGFSADVEQARSLFATPVAGFHIVGSGASLAVGHFLARLLESWLGVPSAVKTPFDFLESWPGGGAVILISASGKNADVLNALRSVRRLGADVLVVLCGDRNSPLAIGAQAVQKHALVVPEEHTTRFREGFFGVQSLISCLASSVSLVPPLREYVLAKGPDWFSTLSAVAKEDVSGERIAAIADAPHIVGLASGWAMPPLLDFESKCVEGGLGWVEVSEAKNFTHGRFVNSFRYQQDTAFVLFRTPDQHRLGTFIREGWRDRFPLLEIESGESGPLASVELFVKMFYLFNELARLRNINISRPDVPDIARRMFKGEQLYEFPDTPSIPARIAELKFNSSAAGDRPKEVDEVTLKQAYEDAFRWHYRALICDYDGTLAEANSDAVDSRVGVHVTRLLDNNIPLAVVTGRGASCLRELRLVLPRAAWHKVYCYLYNGAICQTLDQEVWIRRVEFDRCDEVRAVLQADGTIVSLTSSIELATSRTQVTLHIRNRSEAAHLLDRVQAVLGASVGSAVTVRSSGRSVDVFPSTVSKRKAVEDFLWRALGDSRAPALIVGDQAAVGGNDHDLLQLPNAFSVGTLHWLPRSGFPVAVDDGAPIQGPLGLVTLLSNVIVRKCTFQLGRLAISNDLARSADLIS